MRFVRTAVTVAATAMGVALLGACGGNSGSDAASSASPSASGSAHAGESGAAPTTPASGGPASTTTGGTAGTGTSTGGTATSGTGGNSGTGASNAVSTKGRCHTDDIAFSWATGGDALPDPHSTDQQSAFVMLKNRSAHTCVLHGFPGVDLVNSGMKWSLTRSSQKPDSISLGPGDSTQFTVTYLPWSAEGNAASNNFAATTLVITLPDETVSYDLPWRWGHVLLQDGATHPGTYVSPVGG